MNTVEINGIDYRVIIKGSTKFAQYKPTDEWRASTTPVIEIEQAIREASGEKVEALPVSEPEKKVGRWPMKPDILKVLADGPKTMRELKADTGHGATAIRSAINKLGDQVIFRKAAKKTSWITCGKVNVWELAA